MRNKLFTVLAALAVAVVLAATSARADQLTLGDTCTGSLSVTPGAPPAVGGSVSGCITTFEYGDPASVLVGTFGITGGTGFSTGTFTDGTSFLSGTIYWTSFGGNTLDGWLTVGEGGVAGLNGDFVAGGTYFVDLTFKPGTCSADGQTLYGCKVSSGEIIPTPEPGTLTLLGTGLLGLAGIVRRKLGV